MIVADESCLTVHQVKLRKGTILAASRLKKDSNDDKEEAAMEDKGTIIKVVQKENLAPTAAGDFSSSRRYGKYQICPIKRLCVPQTIVVMFVELKKWGCSPNMLIVNDNSSCNLYYTTHMAQSLSFCISNFVKFPFLPGRRCQKLGCRLQCHYQRRRPCPRLLFAN